MFYDTVIAESELNLIVRLSDSQWQMIPPRSGLVVHESCLHDPTPRLLRTYIMRGDTIQVVEYSNVLDIFSIYELPKIFPIISMQVRKKTSEFLNPVKIFV